MRVQAALVRALELGADNQLTVDMHRPAVADGEPPRHDGEAVPGREQAARLVKGRGDQPAVDETGPGLVPAVEGEARLVARRALGLGEGQAQPSGRVAAAPAAGVVVRRDGTGQGVLQRLLAADERAQALVLLAAGGAAVEVGAQAGNRGVGVLAGELELDVAVELVEADVAADLGPAGPRSRPSACFRSGRSISCLLQPGVEREAAARLDACAACGARRAGSCRARRGSCSAARRARRSARRSARARRARGAGAASAPRRSRPAASSSSSLCSSLGVGLEPGAREQAPGLRLERHLASLPGALAQLHRRLEQRELVDPGREAAGAAEVVEAREHAHQRVVGGLRWRCRRARCRAGAAASAGAGRPRSARRAAAARAGARSPRPRDAVRADSAATRATRVEQRVDRAHVSGARPRARYRAQRSRGGLLEGARMRTQARDSRARQLDQRVQVVACVLGQPSRERNRTRVDEPLAIASRRLRCMSRWCRRLVLDSRRGASRPYAPQTRSSRSGRAAPGRVGRGLG